MKIKPLTGQVLIFLLPPDSREGAILLPDKRDPDQRRSVQKGIVKEIGPWPRLKNGMAVLPPFGKNATVLISDYAGQKIHQFENRLRLVKVDDILAVLTQ